MTLVSLTQGEYIATIEAAPPVIGGAIYDGLIARCAEKVGAEVLLTWNRRDFIRFRNVAQIVKKPQEFQSGA